MPAPLNDSNEQKSSATLILRCSERPKAMWPEAEYGYPAQADMSLVRQDFRQERAGALRLHMKRLGRLVRPGARVPIAS